jgi:hypothetical protein
MSKFAPHVPESLIDAVSLILGEAKVEPDAPDAAAVARRKALQAIKDRQEDEKAEKGETKPQGIRKVAGTAYGGSKQKHEPEIEEELKGNQHKIDANKNGKIDADDFKKLRGEELKGDQHKIDANKNGKIDSHDFKLLRGKKKANEDIELDERELSPAEADKKEKYVKSMKKGLAGFKARYGSKAKNVMYATATKLAKNEETVTEAIVNHEDIAKHLIKKHGKDVSMDHIEDAIDGMDDAHKVDKREVLHHIKKLTKEEVEINEGKMKDIYTDMMAHADKKGYSSHKEFTPADYDTVGKQHGISGKELAVLAGHKTAAKVANEDVDSKKKDLPFTPDKPRAPIATAGKYGYGPSAAKHLAKLGMKNLKKEETVIEGTGGPIYTKPLVKLGDLLARAKDMRNIKQATIVTPKAENEVMLKKEEAEQVDETMMGKAGCTSEDDKKKAEPVDYDKPTFLRKKDDWRKSNPAHLPKPTKEDVELDERVITPGTGTSPDPLLARTGLNKVLRKPRAGQTNLRNIPGGNLPGSQYKFSDDDKIRQKTLLKTAIKSTLANKEHGVKRKLPEEVSIDETATLDKYIRSMGYDPQHLDKNKKVMFAKTNAYKTFASSQKTEGLYDGGQKGTQDIDDHMSPGATARG